MQTLLKFGFKLIQITSIVQGIKLIKWYKVDLHSEQTLVKPDSKLIRHIQQIALES